MSEPQEVHQWHNAEKSPADYLLVRIYSDGEMTGQRYVNGIPTTECTLQSYPLAMTA